MTNLRLPADLFARPATRDDAQHIVDANIAYELATGGFAETILADVLELWEMKGVDLLNDTCLVTLEDGTFVAYTGVMTDNDGMLLDVHTVVDPFYQDEEALYEYLFQFAEERTMVLLDRDPTIPRCWHTGSIAERTTRRLERYGFALTESDYEMEIHFHEPPLPPQALSGVLVRPYKADQEERAVYAVIAEAFPDIDGQPYRPFEQWYKRVFLHTSSFEPSMLFVAVADGEVVGTILCRIYPEERDGYVWQLAVRRAWRKRGIALHLLQVAFNEYYRRGMRRVSLQVDVENSTGAHQLYARAGMQRRLRIDTLEKLLP